MSADLTRRIELNEAIAQKYKEYRSVIFNERQKMLSDGKVNSTEEKRITIFEGSQGQEESSEHKMQFNIYP